jgi:hypothetical protein
LSSTRDASLYDFQLRIGSITISSPSITDAQAFNQKVLSQSFNSRDYYRMDANGDDNLSITDVYTVYMKILGVGWRGGTPSYRIFTPSEWTTISSSVSNLKATYPGSQSVTITGLANKGNSNFYLVRTGYRN